MAERMVSMQARLAISSFVLVDDHPDSVSEVCAGLGISRSSYYRYRRRFAQEGFIGLLPRSSRPDRSPARVEGPVAELIVATRARLIAEGWDAGARSIRARLARDGVAVPSARTVHRVLVRAGVVQPQPKKRPRSSYQRFEHPKPNSCWQLDGTEWFLADEQEVCILRLIDDRTRMIAASLACEAENSDNAWQCMQTAIERHGVPAMLLSDGGTAFTQRRVSNGLGDFEARLRVLGVNPVVSSPGHPQTCGKKEREWSTLKRWLTAQPPAADLTELQRLLDVYDLLFNTERPHQALDYATPAEIYHDRDKAAPGPAPRPGPCTVTDRRITDRGRVELGNGYRLNLGPEWTGATVTVVRDDLDVIILFGPKIITRLRIDPTRKHQVSGRPKGRPRKQLTSQMS